MDDTEIAELDEEFFLFLQSVLAAEKLAFEEAEFEDDVISCAAIIAIGLEEARQLRATRRFESRLYLIRPDLLPNPRIDTPWQRLFHGRNNRAFITTTGFDVETFMEILDEGFEELWNVSAIPRRDVPSTSVPRLSRRSLDASGALGLVLHFLNSTMIDTTLCEIFAIVPTTVSRYLHFAMKILLATLRKMGKAKIKWPTGDEFQENTILITDRHPLLDGAFGSMDGLNIPVQTSKDQEIENATFNGWLHEHFVSCVFAFGADGVIIGCNLNAPGSWHDSRVAKPLYEKLRTRTPEGYYLVTDTAFPRGTDQIAGRIRAPVKEGTRLPGNIAEREALMAFDCQLLSYRQTAEWGMRALQGTFGRLRVPLPIAYDDLRGDLLECIARLFNLRARSVGHNQIRTVYKDVWDGEEKIWIDFEDILFSDQQKNDRVRRFYIVAADE